MRISDWSSDVCSSDLPTRPSILDDCATAGLVEPIATASAIKTKLRILHIPRIGWLILKMDWPQDTFRADHRRVHRRVRSEEHTSELQSLMRSTYAVICLKKKSIHQVKRGHTNYIIEKS